MKKLLLISSISSFGINTIQNVNSLNNKINNLLFLPGIKIDISVKPGQTKINTVGFELINYGFFGCNTFNEFVNRYDSYSDPYYFLHCKIGNNAKWSEENRWLSIETELSYFEDRIKKESSENVLNESWTNSSNTRKTFISVKEYFIDSLSDKTIYIYWNYHITNQNRLENIYLKAHL